MHIFLYVSAENRVFFEFYRLAIIASAVYRCSAILPIIKSPVPQMSIIFYYF